MRCDKCGWYRPKHAVCEFDDTLTEPYESCLNWKPITHADLIRAMTDEELAVFLKSARSGCRAITTKSYVCDYYTEWAETDCDKCWLDWLKQEVTAGE